MDSRMRAAAAACENTMEKPRLKRPLFAGPYPPRPKRVRLGDCFESLRGAGDGSEGVLGIQGPGTYHAQTGAAINKSATARGIDERVIEPHRCKSTKGFW